MTSQYVSFHGNVERGLISESQAELVVLRSQEEMYSVLSHSVIYACKDEIFDASAGLLNAQPVINFHCHLEQQVSFAVVAHEELETIIVHNSGLRDAEVREGGAT